MSMMAGDGATNAMHTWGDAWHAEHGTQTGARGRQAKAPQLRRWVQAKATQAGARGRQAQATQTGAGGRQA